MSKKHWSKYLPEVGTIYRHNGQRIESQWERVERIKRELETAERELNTLEREIEELAANDWTYEEIEEAKKRSLNLDSIY